MVIGSTGLYSIIRERSGPKSRSWNREALSIMSGFKGVLSWSRTNSRCVDLLAYFELFDKALSVCVDIWKTGRHAANFVGTHHDVKVGIGQ